MGRAWSSAPAARVFALGGALLACLAGSAWAKGPHVAGGAGARARHDAYGTLKLNGEETEVRWTDGDSFKARSGPYRGHGTRLKGYNTLEAYGPVHRWGEWTARELFALAEKSASVAAAKAWACTSDGKVDGYGRLLVDCPELTRHMVRVGYGMAYSVEGEAAPPDVLALQRQAIAAKEGMWAKGAPKGVVTSVHSVGEEGSKSTEAYNRVADTRDGRAALRKHRLRYQTCQEVCLETDGDTSCMVYVPFERRYRDRPDCLR